MFKVGSLFAGVGGFDLGFIRSDFDVVWANEIDKNACKTYRKNFDSKIYECCIDELDLDKLDYVDVITAGFPCQPFSIAGYQKGFYDERGSYFFSILKVLESIKSKVVVLENVKNILKHDGGKTFSKIIKDLDRNGYDVSYSVLNSIDYGIPQNRERVYIVCFRKDLELKYNFKIRKKKFKIIQLNDLLLDNVDEKYYYNKTKYYPILKKEMTNKNTVYQWRRKYVRENKSSVCPTLTANMGTGGHNVPLVLKNDIRKLTPMECFLLQGFDVNFTLPDDVSDSHLYKQAGNSLCVRIIEEIASNIMGYLLGDLKSKHEVVNEFVPNIQTTLSFKN